MPYATGDPVVPNDPDLAQQWGLARVRAPEAWVVTTGAADVVIAVLDTGADLNHPDLHARLWKNAGEVPFNGVDDDGNGYIDDVNGWRFAAGAGGNDDNQVRDNNGHGTHVAGIAGAATNNGVGVAGVTWAAALMPVKVLGGNGQGAYSDIAAGIVYAANNGADVINLSLGGPDPSQTLCDAVSAATAKGALVVAAAGNEGGTVFYPAMCPGALAVAATDESDAAAAFSNPGARIDLAAPGTEIWSTWYASGLNLSTYQARSGTSQAAAFVTGAAALVRSRWPALPPEGVKAQLVATVVDVERPGKDDQTGWGRLDLAAAVAAAASPVDLRLAAGVAPPSVVAGNPLTATFHITNSGATVATSVTLDAMLPAAPTIDAISGSPVSCALSGPDMTCGVPRLEPGAALSISVVVTPTVVGTGELITAGSVAAAQRELTPHDNRQIVPSAIRPVLAGRVWLDGNGDGILQAWERRGVAGAHLFLEQDGQPIAFVTSNAPDGAYAFATLPQGGFVLRVEVPPEYLLTTPQEIALLVQPRRETVVDFGAWAGVAEPTPSPTFPAARTVYLPLITR
jgi:hypothetical protein